MRLQENLLTFIWPINETNNVHIKLCPDIYVLIKHSLHILELYHDSVAPICSIHKYKDLRHNLQCSNDLAMLKAENEKLKSRVLTLEQKQNAKSVSTELGERLQGNKNIIITRKKHQTMTYHKNGFYT